MDLDDVEAGAFMVAGLLAVFGLVFPGMYPLPVFVFGLSLFLGVLAVLLMYPTLSAIVRRADVPLYLRVLGWLLYFLYFTGIIFVYVFMIYILFRGLGVMLGGGG